MKIRDIRNFVEGHWNHLKQMSWFLELDKHIQEQAVYRAALCQPCLLAGKCKICGCATPEMFYSPYKEDSEKKWGKMLSAEDWDDFKKECELEIPDIDINLLKEVEMEHLEKEVEEGYTLAPWDLAKFMDIVKKKKEANETKG